MKQYVMVPISQQREYAIVERMTGNTLFERIDYVQAKQIARRLNGGSGFNGYTPNFFLARFDVPQDDE